MSGAGATKQIGYDAKYESIRTRLKKFIEATSELGKNDVVVPILFSQGVPSPTNFACETKILLQSFSSLRYYLPSIYPRPPL